MQWFASIETAELALTTITVMELEYGIAKLPDGRKKRELEAFFHDFFITGIAEIIPFDIPAAEEAGAYLATCERRGRPLADHRDAMIACTVL